LIGFICGFVGAGGGMLLLILTSVLGYELKTAVFANRAAPETLNRVTGVILVILGGVIIIFSFLG
jgi:hypothetical protein